MMSLPIPLKKLPNIPISLAINDLSNSLSTSLCAICPSLLPPLPSHGTVSPGQIRDHVAGTIGESLAPKIFEGRCLGFCQHVERGFAHAVRVAVVDRRIVSGPPVTDATQERRHVDDTRVL